MFVDEPTNFARELKSAARGMSLPPEAGEGLGGTVGGNVIDPTAPDGGAGEKRRIEAELQRLGLDDPWRLPAQADVAAVFGLGGAAGGRRCAGSFEFRPGGALTCACAVCAVWRRFVSGELFGARVYEILTVDLVRALAAHVWCVRAGGRACARAGARAQARQIRRARGGAASSRGRGADGCAACAHARRGSSARHHTILEVGAGNGRLSYFLAKVRSVGPQARALRAPALFRFPSLSTAARPF